MAKLSTVEKQILESLFQMGGGYVLNFSDRTMGEFFRDDVGIEIYDDRYKYGSGSKANFIRGFWSIADDKLVGKSILKLIEHIEAQQLIDNTTFLLVNKNLIDKGRKIGERLFNNVLNQNQTISLHKIEKISREFAIEQLNKIDQKLENSDFDGVITNVRSLVEDVLIEVYKEVSGLTMKRNGEIGQYWSKLKKELNLDPKSQLNDSLREVITGLSSIINGLSTLRNIAGDGHSREFKPAKRHAILAKNSAFTFVNFIYDVLEYQQSRVEDLKLKITNLKSNLAYRADETKQIVVEGKEVEYIDRYLRKSTQQVVETKEIKNIINVCDLYLKRILLKWLIESTTINSWEESALFFMKIRMFNDVLTGEDIRSIKAKFENENQAIDLLGFLNEFEATKA